MKIRGRRALLFAESIKTGHMISAIAELIMNAIAFTVWWWFNFWDVFTIDRDVCATGWNLLDYVNYLLAAFYTLPLACLCSLLLLCLICLSPCICSEIRRSRQEEAARRDEEESTTRTFMNSLTKMIYDPDKFKSYTECIICSEPFDQEASITPLPCNVKHYFHTKCITTWLETKKECPLCRH
jgi:hypothetical protein